MMRNILLLVIVIIGLAIVRNLIREIGRFAFRSMSARSTSKGSGAESPAESATKGKLVQDPHTGTYVDPAYAVRAKVGDTIHYFESEASRDAFVKAKA